MQKRIPLTALTTVLLTLAGSASAGDLTYPAGWEGVWDVHTDTRDCKTLTLLGSSDEENTICEGDPFEYDLGFECTGTVSDGAVDVTCVGSYEAFPGCVATVTMEREGTRSGGSLEGVTTLTTVYEGESCGVLEMTCIRNEETGTRTGADPDCTKTPIDGVSWGQIKLRY